MTSTMTSTVTDSTVINTMTKTMPADLPSRYEIRNLGPEHSDWALAILCHTNIFYGPLWSSNYKGTEAVRRCLALYEHARYLVDHQIESGFSFGVFDKEYKPKRPESSSPSTTTADGGGGGGGKLYWDIHADPATLSASALLDAMDFPLVSIALSYDSIHPLDPARLAPLAPVLPAYGEGFARLIANDARDPASWRATAPLQVLFRNATSTRRDYEGRGLMKGLAHWLMRWAAAMGFRGIQIEAFNDAVAKVWTHPPPPFGGEAVSEVRTGEVVVEEGDGSVRRPFGESTQTLTRCYVTLK
ncbi:uncharacterized protein BKCO1_12000133 [Diplodia corticola]|uniref:N-acetyltransferase domain-containing protein n=1 Tax=Diplodia corticola TaxID=236234 RepID=A0A1J9R716_9PEZI|nr:uncharacterized protein BKCO1_12000133 [Diplodia corticola]OJD36329.1 hypothetical protein BKCO1_12000133 [Diplodia corticola]